MLLQRKASLSLRTNPRKRCFREQKTLAFSRFCGIRCALEHMQAREVAAAAQKFASGMRRIRLSEFLHTNSAEFVVPGVTTPEHLTRRKTLLRSKSSAAATKNKLHKSLNTHTINHEQFNSTHAPSRFSKSSFLRDGSIYFI